MDQDARFSNKEKKLLKQMKFDPVLEQKVRRRTATGILEKDQSGPMPGPVHTAVSPGRGSVNSHPHTPHARPASPPWPASRFLASALVIY